MKDALAFAMGMMNRGKEPMVFDWDKAARIIKEKQPIVLRLGYVMIGRILAV